METQEGFKLSDVRGMLWNALKDLDKSSRTLHIIGEAQNLEVKKEADLVSTLGQVLTARLALSRLIESLGEERYDREQSAL